MQAIGRSATDIRCQGAGRWLHRCSSGGQWWPQWPVPRKPGAWSSRHARERRSCAACCRSSAPKRSAGVLCARFGALGTHRPGRVRVDSGAL